MILYLSRHGEASPSGPGLPATLTPRGKSDVTRMAEHLVQKKKIKVSTIWHSPITRALQTAEVYQKAFGLPAPPMEKKKILEPDGDANQAYLELLSWNRGPLLIVSHLPLLPNLSSLLMEGADPSTLLSFPTSALAAFELKESIQFLWSLDPSSLT